MAKSTPRAISLVGLFVLASAVLPAQRVADLVARIDSGNAADRDAAVQELAALGAKAVPGLRHLLEDGEDRQRIGALFGIGKMGKAAAPLLPAVSKLWILERPAVSQAVEQAFVDLGEVGAPELARCVPEFSIQTYACTALAKIGTAGKPAVPALRKLLLSRTLGAHTAATALGAIRDPAAIPDLVKVVTGGADNPRGCDQANVANSAQALGRFGAAAAAAVPALIVVMCADVPLPTMCDRAATALGDIGVRTDAVLAALREVSKNGTGDVQRAAKDSLEVLECAAGASDAVIARAIRHANPELRLLGLQRAAERAAGGSALMPVIVWCYEHSDDVNVRMAALSALGAIGVQDEKVTRVLDAASKDPDAKLAAAAEEVRKKLAR